MTIDLNELRSTIDAVALEHADRFEQCRVNRKLIGWFVGQVMKRTHGLADPSVVHYEIERLLN